MTGRRVIALILLAAVAAVVVAMVMFLPRKTSVPAVTPIKWESSSVTVDGVCDSTPIVKLLELQLERGSVRLRGYTDLSPGRRDTFTVERNYSEIFDLLSYSTGWKFVGSIVHERDMEYAFASNTSSDRFSVFLPGYQTQLLYQIRDLKDGRTLFAIAGEPLRAGGMTCYGWFTAKHTQQ
jgi:hypothetical protein